MFALTPLRRLVSPLGLLICFASVACSVFAEPFIDYDSFDFLSLVPDPPEDDSMAGRADLETVLQLQNDRSPDQLRRVERVAHQTIFSFAAPILGERFNAETLPVTAAFFSEVTRESYAITKRAKTHWSRPRPHLRASIVMSIPRASRSPSYPSGHASDAATWTEIMKELFPERAAEFDHALRDAMWSRVLGGSHYPTDTQAGALLGSAVGKEMLAARTMAEALAQVRSELQENGFIKETSYAR